MRVAERRLRPITIHRLDGQEQQYVCTLPASDPPDAVRAFVYEHGGERGLSLPVYAGDTVRVRNAALRREETYVAVD